MTTKPKPHPAIPGAVAVPSPMPTIAQAMYPNLPSSEPKPKEPRK
jgi:hypothetical protein